MPPNLILYLVILPIEVGRRGGTFGEALGVPDLLDAGDPLLLQASETFSVFS